MTKNPLSGRKVTTAERRKKKEERRKKERLMMKIVACLSPATGSDFARTNLI
jgi:hypothetical protein